MDRFLQLAAFVRTVERGSQAAAARELDMTPAMVGRHIRALEDRLGARLLHRTTARQSLTDAGAAFHSRAVAVLDGLDEAEQSAAAAPGGAPRGTLRVNAPMVFGVRFLAAALAAFHARHPAVRVVLTLDDRVVDLVEGGYDLAVRIGRLPDSSLVARRLATCRMAACAAPSFLARHGVPAVPRDLERLDCLLYAYASIRNGTWTFHGAGGPETVRLSGTLTANNGDALLAAAVAGQGAIVQPTFIVGDALRDGRLVRLLPNWRLDDIHVHAVYPSTRHLSPTVRGLVDFLAAEFRDPPLWDRGIDPG